MQRLSVHYIPKIVQNSNYKVNHAIKENTDANIVSNNFLDKIKKWIKRDQNVVYDILEVFMLITVVNSLMMILGIDPNPKASKFAYIHLMMRLTIISFIMIIIRGKKTITDIKNI